MRKSNSAQRLADAIRRSQLSEKRAIREAIELHSGKLRGL